MIFSSFVMLFACSEEPWNDPYPHFDDHNKTLYTAFNERPKHLDPALSYEASEAVITYATYEPPLQYDYLARPYKLIPLTAVQLPTIRYLDEKNQETNKENAKVSVYRIQIKPNLFYQPHPAFVFDETQGEYLYIDNPKSDMNYASPYLFPKQATKELTAEDYIYQIKRLASPAINSPIQGLMKKVIFDFANYSKQLKKIESNKPGQFINLTDYDFNGVKLIDKYTYEITINGDYPQFLNWLAMPFFAPVPWQVAQFYAQPVLQKKNITLDWFPVGTGAFYLIENNPNLQMKLVKNPNFHGEKFPTVGNEHQAYKKFEGKELPFLSSIVFSLEKESIPYWNKFVQGYYDQSAVTNSNFDQAINMTSLDDVSLSEQLSDRGVKLEKSIMPVVYYWGINMLDKTVGGSSEKNKKLRQAIAIAFDTEEFIKIFHNGSGFVAHGPLAPGIFGYDASLDGVNNNIYRIEHSKPKRKNINAAKKLLKEAGYPNGINPQTGKPLTLHYDSVIGAGPDSAAQLNWIRKQFNKIGIELVVRGTDYNRFQDKIASGNFQLFSWGWAADYPDPENMLFILTTMHGRVKNGGENASNFSNAKFDRLFKQMEHMENSAERLDIINQMLAILHEEMPWFAAFHPISYALRQQWVDAYQPNPIARNTLKYMSIDPKLRDERQTQWNQANFWPILLILLVILIGVLPAIRIYYIKMHHPLVCPKPKSLKEE